MLLVVVGVRPCPLALGGNQLTYGFGRYGLLTNLATRFASAAILSLPGLTPVNLCSLLSSYSHVSHYSPPRYLPLSLSTSPSATSRHVSTYTISLLRRHTTRVILQLLPNLLRCLLVVALASQLGLHLRRLRALGCAALRLGDLGDVLPSFRRSVCG